MAFCEKHQREYQPTVSRFGGVDIPTPCPDCAAEAAAEFARINQKQVANELRSYKDDREIRNAEKRFDRVGIPPRFRSRSFSNFKCDDKGQADALRRTKSYSQRILAGGCGGLILRGSPGTGKTHLACAVGIEFEKAGHSVMFLTVVEMIRKLRECYRANSDIKLQQAIDSFRDLDLLILDEVGVQSGTDDELLLLIDVINARYGWLKPTVLISNMEISEITSLLTERVVDRMREDGGALIEFTWKSFRQNAAKFHAA